MAHTAEQILENYNKLNQIISDNFEGTQQDNIINMVYALGEEKKNAEAVRRMAFKAHFSRREHD